MLLHVLFPSHPIYMVGYSPLEAWQSHPIPPPSLHGREGSSFLGLVPSDNTVDSESALCAPGLQSNLWLIPTFILGSLVRFHH